MYNDINSLQGKVEFLTRRLDDYKSKNDNLEQKLGKYFFKKISNFF